MNDRTCPSLTAVVNQFPAPSQTFVLRKLQGLRDAGFEVQVAGAPLGRGAADLGFPLIALAPWRRGGSPLSAPTRRLSGAAPRLVRGDRGRPLRERIITAPLSALGTDIVHFEFSGIAVTYVDVLEDLRRRSRIAVSCRGSAEQIEPRTDPTRAERLRRVFEVCDLIHCVSDDMRRTVEALGAPPERILVNRPAIPTDVFRPLRSREVAAAGPLRVLSVGRLHWAKGLDDGMRAVAQLHRAGQLAEYRIAGEGPERPKLTFLADQLGLRDRVSLLGATTIDEVVRLLEWADVLLLPSLSEGISNAVLEAMAAGLPVVTTAAGGMPEAVRDGEDGFVVPIGDVAAMGDRLERLAGDPDLRARLGRSGASHVDRDFALERQIGLFVDAYRRIASG